MTQGTPEKVAATKACQSKTIVLLLALSLSACANTGSASDIISTDARVNAELCGEPPAIVVRPQSEELPISLHEGGSHITALRANFEAAYSRACREGIVGENGLHDHQGGAIRTLVLAVTGYGTESVIYWDEDANSEYFLVVPSASPDDDEIVPDIADLHYAIDCAARPSTLQEIEQSGRCLYD